MEGAQRHPARGSRAYGRCACQAPSNRTSASSGSNSLLRAAAAPPITAAPDTQVPGNCREIAGRLPGASTGFPIKLQQLTGTAPKGDTDEAAHAHPPMGAGCCRRGPAGGGDHRRGQRHARPLDSSGQAASGYCTVRFWGTTSCKTETIRANLTYHTINVRACAPDGHYADWQVKDANNGVIVGQGRVPAGACNSRYIFGLYGSYWGWVFNTRRGASMYLDNG